MLTQRSCCSGTRKIWNVSKESNRYFVVAKSNISSMNKWREEASTCQNNNASCSCITRAIQAIFYQSGSATDSWIRLITLVYLTYSLLNKYQTQFVSHWIWGHPWKKWMSLVFTIWFIQVSYQIRTSKLEKQLHRTTSYGLRTFFPLMKFCFEWF